MVAIVKNRNGVEVIAKFVALQVNVNNSATKRKIRIAAIGLCTLACRLHIPGLAPSSHPGHN